MKQALIVIDIQESFRLRPYWDDRELPSFLRTTQGLVDACAARGIPILQVFHLSETDDPADAFSPSAGLARTLAGLSIQPTETFHKTVHSALYARDAQGGTLQDWLVRNGIEEVIICGIRTEQCCETTARHASDAGFQVRYALDATLTFAMQSPSSGRRYTPQEIKAHTELVLAGRFAKVLPAAQALAG